MLPLATNRYPDEMTQPMRQELTSIGMKELRTADEVNGILKKDNGTTLLFINSVCGCAAGGARPALRLALQNNNLPDELTTVFAGVDHDAVAAARSYIQAYPPSSPSLALFKNNELIFMMPRHQIEGRTPQDIAEDMKSAFNTHCV